MIAIEFYNGGLEEVYRTSDCVNELNKWVSRLSFYDEIFDTIKKRGTIFHAKHSLGEKNNIDFHSTKNYNNIKNFPNVHCYNRMITHGKENNKVIDHFKSYDPDNFDDTKIIYYLLEAIIPILEKYKITCISIGSEYGVKIENEWGIYTYPINGQRIA